eukprot:scaffold10199_cov146-Cylindrotheca_fusiformis.AAC.25
MFPQPARNTPSIEKTIERIGYTLEVFERRLAEQSRKNLNAVFVKHVSRLKKTIDIRVPFGIGPFTDVLSLGLALNPSIPSSPLVLQPG